MVTWQRPDHPHNSAEFADHTGLVHYYPKYMVGGGYVVSGDVAKMVVVTNKLVRAPTAHDRSATLLICRGVLFGFRKIYPSTWWAGLRVPGRVKSSINDIYVMRRKPLRGCAGCLSCARCTYPSELLRSM